VHLEKAAEACRAALEVCTREQVPLDWAMTQYNLGNALGALGERERRTARLEEAATAFDACLTVMDTTAEWVPRGACVATKYERRSLGERLRNSTNDINV
jgi:hypothetical protein